MVITKQFDNKNEWNFIAKIKYIFGESSKLLNKNDSENEGTTVVCVCESDSDLPSTFS